jgi:hypothetical protein
MAIHPCVDHVNLKFDVLGNIIRTRGNGGMVLDANGTNNGSAITSWEYNGGANQRWVKSYQ